MLNLKHANYSLPGIPRFPDGFPEPFQPINLTFLHFLVGNLKILAGSRFSVSEFSDRYRGNPDTFYKLSCLSITSV